MTKSSESLEERLGRYSEISLTVKGRKSGKAITRPVWFVWDSGTLYLLPVKGSDTQWYKNVQQDPQMHIDARGTEAEVRAKVITDAEQVKAVVQKFREKYGAGDVKKYYSKFDVAISAGLG